MSGVGEFDSNIQNEQISLLTRAQEVASNVVEWAQDKFESGREKALPYIGSGALVLAGMGVVAGEAQAQEPSASSLKKISSLEHKWSEACKDGSKKLHMSLVGPKSITEMEKPVPYTLVAMSCTALKGVKVKINNGPQDYSWRINLKKGKMYERDLKLKFPYYDPAEIPEGVAWAATTQARRKGKLLYSKQVRFPYNVEALTQEYAPAE